MGLKTIFIGSIEEYLKWDKDPDKKSFEIIYDMNKLRKEVNEMTDQTNDEKKFSKEEAIVNAYISEHPNVDYRTAVLNALDSSEGLGETKEEFTELTSDEINRAKKMIDDIIYNLSLAKKSDSFRKTDQDKLDKAYNLVKEVEESVKILVEKNA